MTGFAATGVGSLPGIHADESTRVVAGELPDLPHVVELPARGPGADIIGRALGMLARVSPDLAGETTPVGWRFTSAPGRVMRRAGSWLAEDLDAAERHFAGAGTVKIAVCGPLTLLSSVELRGGERAIRDVGACREIASAHAEAVTHLTQDVARRLPNSAIIVQVDEPSLPAALAGRIPTASGIATYRAVDPQVAQGYLQGVIDAIRNQAATPWLHCCAPDLPVELVRRCGVEGISTDALNGPILEDLGAALDGGVTVAMGLTGTAQRIAHRVDDLLSRWGFSAESVAARVVLTPPCGLAGASPAQVRDAYSGLSEAGRLLRDEAPDHARAVSS